MKEIEEIEINDNNIKELETKEGLINKLKGTKNNLPSFEKFISDLTDLNRISDTLMSPTEDGWKELDSDDKNDLSESYMKAANSLEAFIKEAESSAAEEDKAAAEVAKKLSELISQEHFAIQYYNPKK